MGFDSGRVNFRMFYIRQGLGTEVVADFMRHAAPSIETLGREPIQGWVSGRHLLDRNLTEDNCVIGSYVYVNLMRAERKIPQALLQANCKLEEHMELQARDATHLPRKIRAEIKARITEELLPKMPPTLTGIPAVIDLRNDLLLAGAMSDSQIDNLVRFIRGSLNFTPALVTAESYALKVKQVNVNDLEPVSFSPDETLEPDIEINLGMEFLTWLWFYWDTDGGNVHIKPQPPFSFMLEGPLTFYRQGQGAHEAIFRKGTPLNSREAGIALMCGKKLKRAKFVLAQGDQSWSVTIDDDLCFRSLGLPKIQQFDAAGSFLERMMAVETFWKSFLSLYERFLDIRKNRQKCPETVAAMRDWTRRLAQGNATK